MKTTRKELEIDFIGGQEPLTAKEEKALSDFFSRNKTKKENNPKKKKVQPLNLN